MRPRLALREAVLGCSRDPFSAKPAERHMPFGSPCFEGRDLRRAGGVLAARGHVVGDLSAPLREVLDDGAWNDVEVGDAVDRRRPPKPETLGSLQAQRRLVQESSGLRMAVQRPAVERSPSSIRPLCRIGDDDMGVEQRIAGA